jgi:hypothetical protein
VLVEADAATEAVGKSGEVSADEDSATRIVEDAAAPGIPGPAVNDTPRK